MAYKDVKAVGHFLYVPILAVASAMVAVRRGSPCTTNF